MLKEFKEFAIRGNVIDLAVGVIIGGAFNGIITSLVNDILTPIIGLFTGGIDFSDKVLILRDVTETLPEITLRYGFFITRIIDFLIVAFVIFLFVRQINRLHRKPSTPSDKECPYCFEHIPRQATRCPRCTSTLPPE